MKIKPEPEDYRAADREHGPLPPNASVEEAADRYRLVQAYALGRLYLDDLKETMQADERSQTS